MGGSSLLFGWEHAINHGLVASKLRSFVVTYSSSYGKQWTRGFNEDVIECVQRMPHFRPEHVANNGGTPSNISEKNRLRQTHNWSTHTSLVVCHPDQTLEPRLQVHGVEPSALYQYITKENEFCRNDSTSSTGSPRPST